MKTLKTQDQNFKEVFSNLLNRAADLSQEVEPLVKDIIQSVRQKGDDALKDYCEKFDHHRPEVLKVSSQEISVALKSLKKEELAALKLAATRIKSFHQKQFSKISKTWTQKKDGVLVGERISPIERAGIYVPGGLAAYPSTVLMNAIPAHVAGVKEIVMVTPWPQGKANPYTLAAAHLAGVDSIFKVGGAQAIAALAYGTQSIPSVDKITGPGNIFVATAKRLVFGKVGIDMVAGPTEVVIVANDSANPEYIAADLLSQAEHDPNALAVLLTHSSQLISKTHEALDRQLATLDRQDILKKSLSNQGYLILTKTLNEAISLANELASEHLELQIKNPQKYAAKINAGAIFMGNQTPVAVGDYLAGPNHVLPTSATARFSSPLGVWDFLKRTSLIEFSPAGLKKLGPSITRLAQMEGLTAHAASVAVRLKKG